MAKKPKTLTQVQKIKEITKIRARNNILWMALLELAVESSPKRAKIILEEITANDREVSDWLSRL